MQNVGCTFIDSLVCLYSVTVNTLRSVSFHIVRYTYISYLVRSVVSSDGFLLYIDLLNKAFLTDVLSFFLCCTFTLLSKVRGGFSSLDMLNPATFQF